MMFSLALSRVLGLLRDTVMVSQFQAGLATDAYRIAFSIPDLLFMLIAGGGLSSAFIPVFSEFFHTDREEEAWDLFSVVVCVSSAIVLGLITIAWFAAPWVASYISEGKTHLVNGVEVPVGPGFISDVVMMSRIMLPAQFAFLIGSILLGTLYARHRFAAPGLAPNVYNFGIIGGAIAGPILGVGIFGMSWGALIGAVVGNLLIPIAVMIKLGSRFKVSFNTSIAGVDKFFKLLLPVILGFSLPSVCGLITTKFASMYGEGINTVLNLSNNLMQAPLGIFGHSLALAAFPVLAQFYAQERMDLYRDQVSRTLRTTIYLAFPAAAIMLSAAPQIVHVLYEYGKQAKEVETNHAIAVCLQVFSLGVVAWCVQPVLMRGFFSIHKTFKPIILSTGMTALFIILCYANTVLNIGYIGLPVATNIAAILLAIILFFALEGDVGHLDRKGLLITLGRTAIASAAMGGFIFGVFKVVSIHHMSRLIAVLTFGFVLVLAAWVYFYITRAFKMPETEYLSRAMNRVNKKLRPIAEVEAHSE